MPKMKFTQAICDAFDVSMEQYPEIFLCGVGLMDPKGVFDSIKGLFNKYGPMRVVEGPLAEQMLTGMAFGASNMGLRPVLIHHRIDFLPLTMDQVVNHAAKWRYMFGNQQGVPMVIRGVVGTGWGNGPQHTQSMHGLAAQIPGVKVVVPSNPADAKGLMISAMLEDDPVIYIDHRCLHNTEAEVPAGLYREPLGKAKIVRSGASLTMVAVGPMVQECLQAAETMQAIGIDLEVIDLRTLRPIDFPTIITSVEKTGHLVVADADWAFGGVAATIISEVSKTAFSALRAAPATIQWPDHPIPASYAIDSRYYPAAKDVVVKVSEMLAREHSLDVVSLEKPKFAPF